MKVIKTYEDLHRLHLHLYRYDIFRKGEKYRIDLPQWDAEQNKHTSFMMNKYSSKYGFASGMFLMGLAVALYVLDYFISGGTIANAGLKELIALAVWAVSGAVTGKLSGLLYARWIMIKFIQRLIQ